ncbi:MAG: TonB-dependent receptor [Verrucomicrobia bacterium]|nr:MAG: TonB-dependent receptor [Verrucomicrobiota bacterium]
MNPRNRVIVASALAFALGTGATAIAQSASDKEPESIDQIVELSPFEVTGSFAGSIAAATEAKQFAPLVVEALVAEDIGKLPDTSIAESLSRLPGISSQRVNGRSQVITIRGFPAEFSTGLLNGREQASSSSHRNVEYDQYPAELLHGAMVYKTTNASLIGQGISGTVDMRTVRPLAHGKRTFAANAFYEWTEMGKLNAGSDDAGLRYSATYIDQFADDTIGLAIGYAHMDKPGQGEQWQAWGYPTIDTADHGTVSIIGGAKPFVRSSSLNRDSVLAVFEHKVSENVHYTVDLFVSDFAEQQLLRGIEIPLQWSSARFVEGSEVVEDGFVVKGTFENVYGVVRNDIVDRDADVLSGGVNIEFGNLGGGWTAEADISYSKVERVDTVLETYSGTGSNQTGPADTMQFSMESGTGAVFTPSIDYTDTSVLKLTSPQGWSGDIVPGGQVGYLKRPTSDDKVYGARITAERELDGFLSNLKIGAYLNTRSKAEFEEGYFLGLASGNVEDPFPTSIGVTDLSFIGIPGMASYDPLAEYQNGRYELIENKNADVVSVDWDVDEDIALGFVQLGIDTHLGGIPVTGDIGFQYVNTRQSSAGISATGRGESVENVPVSASHSYGDFVPSLNLNFRVSERQFVRFFAGRQIMRQRMQDMRAGFQFGYDPAKADSTDPFNGPWSGSGGNTALEPWRANALDLSFEHYFADGMGYWSVAGFYKDLRTFAYNQRQIRDFTGFPWTGDQPPAIFEGAVDMPVNGKGGDIKGVEVTLSLAGEKLTDILKGFGTIATAAWTDSNITPNPGDPSQPIPGFSKWVGSLTFYYEQGGFSARISGRYRSEYRANVATFGPRGEDFRTVQPETLIDAQISYAFSEGPLKGFSVIAQAYNLNNEPLVTYDGNDSRLVRDYQLYGRSYSVGVSYKF